MKKTLLLLFALLTGVSEAWADVLPSAVVGTTAFQATALTTGASGHTITKDGSGNVTILPNSGNLGTYPNNYLTCTLVVKINVPSTTTANVLCQLRKTSGDYSAAQGLYMDTDRKLTTSWENGSRKSSAGEAQLTEGEHTIIYTASSSGANVYIDGTSNTLSDTGLKAGSSYYKAIYIPAAYAQYITEVHFYSSIQNATNITSIVTECSNHIYASQETGASVTVPSGKMLVIDKDDNLSKYSFDGASNIFIASGKTLSLDKDGITISSLTGCGTALQSTNITTTVTGNLTDLTLKATAGTLTYTGTNLSGTTLDGVILGGSQRITTSGTVNIKNLAGNNLSSSTNSYAFVGSGTLNFYGTCDLTKKSDGTATTFSKLGYASGNNIIIKSGANITASDIYNSSGNNAAITVEGTISATFFGGAATLAEGSTTTLSDATPFDGAVTVSGNATLNLTNATSALNQAITVTDGKTLTINGGSNTVNLTSAVSGSGNIVLSYFPTAATHPTLTSWTGTFEFADGGNNSTDLEAIFNAWGNANSAIKLNNVNGGFLRKDGTVNPSLNILSGKTLTLNNGYSNSNSTITKVTGAGTIDRKGWSGSTNHNLYITTLTDFTGTLKGSGYPIIVKKLVLPSPPYVDTRLIKTTGTVTLDKLYIGLEETTAYSWETKTVEDVEGIYVSALDQVQLYREMAVAAVMPYFANIGAGVGQYTISLGVENYTTISDFETAILAWADVKDCSLANVTINQPTSAFYRIKSGSKYLQDARKSDSATQRTLTDAVGANESAETIFYLNGNTLVGYKTGFGFGFSVCQTRDTEHLNTQRFTESAEMGKYTIQSQKGTYDSADWNEGYWGIDDSDLFRVADAASGACWTIESVTSLPITLNGVGDENYYATLCLPCDVTIDGANAYTLAIRGSWAVPTAVPNNQVPAGTPVLLKGTSATATATINTGDSFGSAINNALTGTYAAIDILSTNGSDYYLGRYRETEDDDYVVGFYHWDQNVLSGFRAYLTAATVNGSGVKGFAINWGGETGVESIEHSPLTIDHEAGAMFDLSGRRVSKAQKGLYIQNGKKVMVK